MKKNWMSTKYLLVFFALTLAWTWICGFIPVIFGLTGTGVGTFIFYFGGGAPSVVALFLVFLTYPKDKRADYAVTKASDTARTPLDVGSLLTSLYAE